MNRTREKNLRYLLFADILGTKASYSNSLTLTWQKRALLDKILDGVVIPRLDSLDARLYVASDSVILAVPEFPSLLQLAAQLFAHCLKHSLRMSDFPQYILLRGGISYGTAMEAKGLRASPRVQVLNILDDSMPKAYYLESLRQGSRLFLDHEIPYRNNEVARLIVPWEAIPGVGNPALSFTREYHWPGAAAECPIATILPALHASWLRFLNKADPLEIRGYDEALLHLDETVKLLIRCCPLVANRNSYVETLLRLLPNNQSEVTAIEFEWGVWFQAIRALLQIVPADTSKQSKKIHRCIQQMKQILCDTANMHYWSIFVAELIKPDYMDLKNNLVERFGDKFFS
ncbi:MAG: hypothetical protein ACRD98_01830 [Nitrososphaera sp.]